MVGTTVEETIQIPSNKVGKVIGSRGATLRDIESDYGVKLIVGRSQPEDVETAVTISGSADGVTAAIARVEDIADISNGIDHLRDQERKLRSKVNELYQAAQSATGKQRSNLFDQAHQAEAELAEAQAVASRNIFAAKNAGYGLDQMDLHGQYLKEALELVQERLLVVDRQLQGREIQLTIITGAGNHSEGGVSKIKTEVKELLDRGGYAYTTETSGSFVVASRRAGASGPAKLPDLVPDSAPAASPSQPVSQEPSKESEKDSLPSWANAKNAKTLGKALMACFAGLYHLWSSRKKTENDTTPDESDTMGLDVEAVART